MGNFNYVELGGRPTLDPKFVQQILKDDKMLAEQGSGFCQGWGGPSLYVQLAKLPRSDRLVYAAILDGNVDNTSIAAVTGLPTKSITTSLVKLRDQGLVETTEAPVAEPLSP